jgi:hypothetical protein
MGRHLPVQELTTIKSQLFSGTLRKVSFPHCLASGGLFLRVKEWLVWHGTLVAPSLLAGLNTIYTFGIHRKRNSSVL